MHLPALQLPDLSVPHHRLRSIHRARWLAYLMGRILEPQVADLPLSFRSLVAEFDSRLGYMKKARDWYLKKLKSIWEYLDGVNW